MYNRIFWLGTITILILNKSFELWNSFDMVQNPIETSAKIIVMIYFAYKIINGYLLPRVEAC